MDAEESRSCPSIEANVQQQSRPSIPKRERRSHPRQPVDSRATVILVKSGSSLPGQILDLSVGGCCIRTDDKFQLGIYTRVEAEFCLQGMTFLLGGVIQSIHDSHSLGIRFLDVSRRKLDQLEQLIAEITQTP